MLTPLMITLLPLTAGNIDSISSIELQSDPPLSAMIELHQQEFDHEARGPRVPNRPPVRSPLRPPVRS